VGGKRCAAFTQDRKGGVCVAATFRDLEEGGREAGREEEGGREEEEVEGEATTSVQ